MVREATGEVTDTGNVASGDTVHQRLHCSEGDRTKVLLSLVPKRPRPPGEGASGALI